MPYLLVLLLVSSADSLPPVLLSMRRSRCFRSLGWAVAIAGLRYRIPVLHRIAAPASALLVLNAAAVVGLYKFLFTRGPLWKIWNSSNLRPMRPIARNSKTLAATHLPPLPWN